MDNITRLKAATALHAVVMLLNELDRVQGPSFTRAFVEDHQSAINAALAAIERALEFGRW